MASVPIPLQLDPLIAEAKRRQRRRRLALLAAVLAAGAAGYGIERAVGSTQSPAPGRLPVVDVSAFAGHGRLAFVSRGRLYVLDGTTGELARVAGVGARSPSFSPDGRRLAWVQGARRFGVARADGTGASLLASHGFPPRWLPDGRLLVGGALYRVERGTVVRAGTAPEGLVSWTPDGRLYAFTEQKILGRNGDGSFRKVERVETAPSLNGPRTIWYEAPSWFDTKSGYRGNGISAVVVLPRGGLLVWLDPMHSASLAADGQPVVEIRAPLARPQKLGVTVGTPLSVSARGRIALGAGGDRIAWTTKHVVTCAAGRCSPVATPPGRLTTDPALSPDGRTLAYVTSADMGIRASTLNPTLRRWYATRTLRVGARTVPDSTGAAAPVWSADGRSLLYVAGDALWLLPALDGKPLRIAGPLLWPHGVWSNYYGQLGWSALFAWHS